MLGVPTRGSKNNSAMYRNSRFLKIRACNLDYVKTHALKSHKLTPRINFADFTHSHQAIKKSL